MSYFFEHLLFRFAFLPVTISLYPLTVKYLNG